MMPGYFFYVIRSICASTDQVCHNQNPHRVCNKSMSTGATSGTGTRTLPEHRKSPPVFSWIRVSESSVLCVVFCLSFFSILLSVVFRFTVFDLGKHCIVFEVFLRKHCIVFEVFLRTVLYLKCF